MESKENVRKESIDTEVSRNRPVVFHWFSTLVITYINNPYCNITYIVHRVAIADAVA